MDGQKRPYGVPFNAPDGSMLAHPGDSSLGAGAAMVINCRCVLETVVDFIAIEMAA